MGKGGHLTGFGLLKCKALFYSHSISYTFINNLIVFGIVICNISLNHFIWHNKCVFLFYIYMAQNSHVLFSFYLDWHNWNFPIWSNHPITVSYQVVNSQLVAWKLAGNAWCIIKEAGQADGSGLTSKATQSTEKNRRKIHQRNITMKTCS